MWFNTTSKSIYNMNAKKKKKKSVNHAGGLNIRLWYERFFLILMHDILQFLHDSTSTCCIVQYVHIILAYIGEVWSQQQQLRSTSHIRQKWIHSFKCKDGRLNTQSHPVIPCHTQGFRVMDIECSNYILNQEIHKVCSKQRLDGAFFHHRRRKNAKTHRWRTTNTLKCFQMMRIHHITWWIQCYNVRYCDLTQHQSQFITCTHTRKKKFNQSIISED